MCFIYLILCTKPATTFCNPDLLLFIISMSWERTYLTWVNKIFASTYVGVFLLLNSVCSSVKPRKLSFQLKQRKRFLHLFKEHSFTVFFPLLIVPLKVTLIFFQKVFMHWYYLALFGYNMWRAAGDYLLPRDVKHNLMKLLLNPWWENKPFSEITLLHHEASSSWIISYFEMNHTHVMLKVWTYFLCYANQSCLYLGIIITKLNVIIVFKLHFSFIHFWVFIRYSCGWNWLAGKVCVILCGNGVFHNHIIVEPLSIQW